MYTNSDSIDIIIGYETDRIIEELLSSLLQRYQKGLEEKIRRSEFLYDSIDLLHYKLHKIGLNRRGLYIDSSKWLKDKKATVNPENGDDNCFLYAVIVALNHQNINNHPKRISNIKPL